MTTKQKFLWALPYVALFAAVFAVSQHAIDANATTAATATASAAFATDHAKVNWNAMQPEPDPSPRSIAAYGFEGS